MRIAIDIRSLTDQRLTGIGLYTQYLVQALAQASPKHEIITFASGSEAILNRLPRLSGANITQVEIPLPNRLLFALLKIPGGPTLDYFLPQPPDIWIFPKFNIFKTNKPYLITVHDLAFELFPQFITTKERIHNSMSRIHQTVAQANGILTVSHSTAWDIHEQWYIDEHKIFVTPLGVDQQRFQPKEHPADHNFRAAYDLNRPYLLALATHEPRKNLESVVQAYENYRAQGGQKIPLVFSGPPGWKTSLLSQRLATSEFQSDMIVLGYIPEKHKPAIYRGATACLFPAFYEGFGLPALEAIACGIPVITSVTSSLPEVVGQVGIMVDPFNVNDVTCALKEILDDSHGTQLRQLLQSKMVAQVKPFTWERTAQTTLDAIRAVLKTS